MPERHAQRQVADWPRSAAWMLWTALAVIALVVVVRKLSGEFRSELPAGAFAALLLCAAGAGLAARVLFQMNSRERSGRGEVLSGLLTLVPPFALGAAVLPSSIVLTSALAVLFVLCCAAVLLIGVYAPRAGLMPARPSDAESRVIESATAREPGPLATEEVALPREPVSGEEDETVPLPLDPDVRLHERSGRVLQWMTRSVGDDGLDAIEGAVQVEFAAGQKEAVVHLSFCPPFSTPPEVCCEDLDGVDLQLKVSAVYAFGARLQARRGDIAGPQRVEVGFTASATVGSRVVA